MLNVEENLKLDTGEKNYLQRFIRVRSLPDIFYLADSMQFGLMNMCSFWTGKRRKHMVVVELKVKFFRRCEFREKFTFFIRKPSPHTLFYVTNLDDDGSDRIVCLRHPSATG